MKKYVISLKPRRECRQTPGTLAKAIKGLPDVRILEGEGLRAVTVEMSEETAQLVRQRISFATVSTHSDLELL